MKGTANAPATKIASSPPVYPSIPPDHILVAEDDVFFRAVTTEALSRSGYEVDEAADGAAAWQALKAHSYDLLITDNSMPKLSGIELLKKLREARMALPVIMATGLLPEAEFARNPWLQPDATLLKPYRGEQLLRTVKRVLRKLPAPAESTRPSVNRDLKDNQPFPAREPAEARRHCPTNSPMRILVVDEDQDLRRMYSEALAGLGYLVDAAEDGAAAWDALRTHRYTLLITEHEMPHLTGVELAKMVRAARMALPIVMAADRLPLHELARNPSLQLAATLSKPFVVDALLDTVQILLRGTDNAREQTEPLLAEPGQPSAGP